MFLGGNDFYAANDNEDDKKLVNISIDELAEDVPSDAEMANQRQIDRSKWIEVIRDGSNHVEQSMHNCIVQKYQQQARQEQGQSSLHPEQKKDR